MRLGIITNFPPSTGAGKYAFELFRNMPVEDVTMVYCNSNATGLRGYNDKNIQRISGIKFPVYKETLNWYFYYPRKIPDCYDIYHVTNQFLSRVCKFRKPSVLTVLDLVLLKSKKYAPALTNYLQKNALKNMGYAGKIIAISEDTKKDLMNILNVDESKIEVIYLGVNHEIFKPRNKNECRKKLGLPLDKKIILHVGSDDPRRNFKTVLKSFYELQKKHDDCILVKIGRLSEKSTGAINEMGLNSKISRFEGISEESLPLYYSSSDVFLCLDIETGFGMPSLEAMACGINVICSNGGAFPEIVGKNGILVEPTNVDEITFALDKLLSAPRLRGRLSKAALHASKTFSWKNCAKKTLGVYEEIL